MRKDVLKRVSALTMAGVMTMSLAGCGGGAKETEAAPAETKAAETTAAAAEEKTEAAGGEEVTLRLVHYMGEQAKRDGLDAMLKAFNEAHPEIKVDIEVVASSSYLATYKNYIAAGRHRTLCLVNRRT